MTILIKNGTIVTASDIYNADILIRNGMIAEIGRDIAKITEGVIDATDKYVFPGAVDVHTHLDRPCGETSSADDFESGTVAAACGGTTTLIDYALQPEGGSLREGLDNWMRKAEGKTAIDYSFHLTITDFSESVLAEMPAMINAGVSSFRSPIEDGSLFQLLQRGREIGALICASGENRTVSDLLARRMLGEGKRGPKYYPLAWPPELEGEAVGRAVALAEMLRAPLYLNSVSAAHALERIKAARDKGNPVFAETCCQYLALSVDSYEAPGFEPAKFVCLPPLRPRWHQEILWRGLSSGDLQVVASDHAPFNFKEQKELGLDDFTRIPAGLPGIESRLQVLYTAGVIGGRISLNKFVDLVATSPAKLFGLFPRKGTIAIGSDADLVVYDPNGERVISAESHHMRVDYNPFEGFKARGSIAAVLLRGNIIVRDGKFSGRIGAGEFLKRKPFSL